MTQQATLTDAERQKLRDGVAELRNYDHVFLTVEGAEHFGAVFGVTPRTYLAKDNRHEPKGLALNGDLREARGVAAEVLARQICDQLGVAYDVKMGRGFQLHACCDALAAWIEGRA